MQIIPQEFLCSVIDFYEATAKLFYCVKQQFVIAMTGNLTDNLLLTYSHKIINSVLRLLLVMLEKCCFPKLCLVKQTYICIILDKRLLFCFLIFMIDYKQGVFNKYLQVISTIYKIFFNPLLSATKVSQT